MSEPKQCIATSQKTGERCGGWALRDGEYCYFHDPSIDEIRTEANHRGGEHNAIAIRVSGTDAPIVGRLVDCLSLVNATIGELWAQNRNTPSRARALLAASAEAREILRTSDFEARLARLEELLAAKDET